MDIVPGRAGSVTEGMLLDRPLCQLLFAGWSSIVLGSVAGLYKSGHLRSCRSSAVAANFTVGSLCRGPEPESRVPDERGRVVTVHAAAL